MATHLPPHWTDLKRELMEKWHELTERDLERTRGHSESIVELIEKKVGLAIDEASERFSEIASRYHLYDEPEETKPVLTEEKKERVLELKPKKPANRDRKPKEDFRA
ncbi:transcriptional regulator [Bdellovibrio reynosensis]|uniref:Transcriptional regulator n=1 Tax=Bdellovibrio reynosensis TaxID=2835041 RepID=A0ABY4C9V0_9BACT|nr:transcriptional regulator [Bdellovibrio reynosensis]UOF01564.1 transcriptional regulator [Bdellovibrio reynosensis]